LAPVWRSPDRISIGTREQLSTLYRLCLVEYLQTAIVLDDQLVQSDETRMEWFRGLLTEKARSFRSWSSPAARGALELKTLCPYKVQRLAAICFRAPVIA
jgi:hypothetical protein